MSLVTELLHTSRLRRSLPPPAVARVIRQRAGITQVEVGRVLGVDRVTVTRWENGTRVPRGELRHRYIELLSELAAENGDT